MTRILITYQSMTGDVARGAAEIATGARGVADTEVVVKPVEQVTDQDLLDADGIAFGSLKFYGSIGPEMAKLFQRIFPLRERFRAKVGAAFSGSPNQFGGQEHVIDDLIHCMLQAGQMIVVGTDPVGVGFVGGVTVEPGNEKVATAARTLGARLATVAAAIKRGMRP